MEHLVHTLLPAVPVVLAIGWFLVIDKALEADRAVCKARKEKRDRVRGCK